MLTYTSLENAISASLNDRNVHERYIGPEQRGMDGVNMSPPGIESLPCAVHICNENSARIITTISARVRINCKRTLRAPRRMPMCFAILDRSTTRWNSRARSAEPTGVQLPCNPSRDLVLTRTRFTTPMHRDMRQQTVALERNIRAAVPRNPTPPCAPDLP